MYLTEEQREARRSYMRRYRAANRDRIRETNRRWRKKKLEEDPMYFKRLERDYWERKAKQSM